jgi:nucleotide-binding universal stress UspA family protein
MDPQKLKRILVATDFSDLSAEAIATAVAFARPSGGTVDLVHVAVETAYILPPPIDVVAAPVDMAAIIEEIGGKVAAEQQRVRAQGVTCESNILVGRADAEIVAHAAQTNADLIVLGTHGRGGLAHALLGSIAEKVVQHAKCPVLTIPRPR